jgi:hypothetical protein
MDVREEMHSELEIGAAVGLPQADQIASLLKNTALSIARRAKIRKAYAQLQSSGVESLTPVQKDLLLISRPPTEEEKARGVTFVNAGVPSYAPGAGVQGAITNEDPAAWKKFIPYIIGVVVIGILIYFISKKKK